MTNCFVLPLSLLIFLLNPCPLVCSLASLPSNNTTLFPRLLCHPQESSALLEFKNSFPTISYSPCPKYPFPNCPIYWDPSQDCCEWSGIQCDETTGHVIGLRIGCGGLEGALDSNNTLFSLSHLETLDLSLNDFQGSKISPNFGRFLNLTHLHLFYCNFVGEIPPQLSHLSKLLTLNLSVNSLEVETGGLKRFLENLTSLQELRMFNVDMSNVSPNIFSNLSSLRLLDIGNSKLIGPFPESVCNLPNLEALSLSLNPNLTGLFPQHNWSSPLKELDLSETGFLIDLPNLARNLKHLNDLDIKNCSFLGHFPDNPIEIPWTSLSTENLTRLEFSNNYLAGQIPEICIDDETLLCDHSSNHRRVVGPIPLNLQLLFLENNHLRGPIPSWLYRLPYLEYLNLAGNQFSGRINEFRYNSLRQLDFSSNRLDGPFPASVFRQPNLFILDLSSNNLSGIVMLQHFSNLKYLENFHLSFNRLSVVVVASNKSHSNYTLPDFIWSLGLSSCNITEFPYGLRNLRKLGSLDLSNNRIEGIVPKWFWNVTKDSLYYIFISHNLLTRIGSISLSKGIQYMDFQSNRLQGELPIPPPSTIFFSVANNQLIGEISTLICDLEYLDVLDLSYNKLSGKIAPCGRSFRYGISVLDLRMNNFEGRFPLSFSKGSFLRTLNLNGNKFQGTLSQSLLNCENLEVLDIGNNEFNGSFPSWLEFLPNLRVLILRSNKFSGQIDGPKINSPFQKLTIIDISSNEFEGFLPAKYFDNFAGMINASSSTLEYIGQKYYQDSVRLVNKGSYIELEKIQKLFITIDFSNNNFAGDIPNVIGKLGSLKGLNFSHNKLNGSIPSSLGNLNNLEFLDLSSNEILGNIPQKLASNLYQLQILNLSNNKLEGPIPRGPQFNTFEADSFAGNSELCGPPLPKSCTNVARPREESDDEDDEHGSGSLFDLKAAMIGCASGLIIGISIGYMLFFGGRFDFWIKKKLGKTRRQNAVTSVRPSRRSSSKRSTVER